MQEPQPNFFVELAALKAKAEADAVRPSTVKNRNQRDRARKAAGEKIISSVTSVLKQLVSGRGRQPARATLLTSCAAVRGYDFICDSRRLRLLTTVEGEEGGQVRQGVILGWSLLACMHLPFEWLPASC